MSNFYILIETPKVLQVVRENVSRTLDLAMDPERDRRWPGFLANTERATLLLRENPFLDTAGIKFGRYSQILCVYPADIEDRYGYEVFESLKVLGLRMALLRGLNEQVAVHEQKSWASPPEFVPTKVQIGARTSLSGAREPRSSFAA